MDGAVGRDISHWSKYTDLILEGQTLAKYFQCLAMGNH